MKQLFFTIALIATVTNGSFLSYEKSVNNRPMIGVLT